MMRMSKTITARLVGYLVLTSTALTLVLVCIQIYMDYTNETDRIEKSVSFIKESFVPLVAEDLWNLDRDALVSTMVGVSKVDYIEKVSLRETDKTPTLFVGKISDPYYMDVRTMPIYYNADGKRLNIGELEIVFGLNQVYSNLVSKFSVILLSNFVKTLLIIFLIFMVFDRVLTKHLRRLADFLSQEVPIDELQGFRFERKIDPYRSDELDQVETSLNVFIGNLREAKKTYERESKQKQDAQKKALNLAQYVGIAEVSNGIIHNLRNLISILYMASVWIQEKVKMGDVTSTDKKFYEKVEKMQYAVETAKDIVKAQQDSSYSGNVKYTKRIKLKEFVDSTLYLMDFMISHQSVRIDNRIDGKVMVIGNTSDLVNVVINLIKNSVEAMQNQDQDERVLVFASTLEGGVRILDITDSGCGISQENLKKLFTFGFTSKSKGHGYGLHSCRTILQGMDGDLEITSRGPGRGSTASIRLPEASSEAFEDKVDSIA